MLSCDAEELHAWRHAREEMKAATPEGKVAVLRERATRTRRSVVDTISKVGLGHVGGDLSVTDILTTLFTGVLRLDPEKPEWADRDRLILSKGHCAASYYATLAFTGFFSPTELETFVQPLSPLNGHPNRTKVPGVEANTGPLGHGLPVGVGQAIGARLRKSSARVFVVLGDGEMQEGSNWEALMAGAHQRLDNLTIVIDRNFIQQGDRTEETNALEPLTDKLASFGWEVRESDGHDYLALLEAFRPSTTGRPVAVVAYTTKGKGVSFMEDSVEWHHRVPNAEETKQAMAELS